MFKILLLIIIVIICALLGYIYGENFNKRFVQLKELLRIIINLQNEILFCYTPLPECFKKISSNAMEPLNKVFYDIGNKLENNQVDNVYIAVSESINENKKNMNLTDEDYNILLDLGKSLGDTNIDGHLNIFELTKDGLKRQVSLADEECRKNRKLYRYLGVSLGFMIAIFLV